MKRYNVVAYEHYNTVQSDTEYWITYDDFAKYQEETQRKILNLEKELKKYEPKVNISDSFRDSLKKDLELFLYESDPMRTGCMNMDLSDEYSFEARIILKRLQTFMNGMYPINWEVVPMCIKWCVETVFDENFESIKLPNEKLENIVEFLNCSLRDELTNE